MDIVICEDDIVQLEGIKTIIANYAMIEDNGIEIVLATTNPDDVVTFLQKQKADCYFLDIDLNHERTGIQIGKLIREEDPLAQLVFVTTHAEMSYLTFVYKLAALDFIIKDQPEFLQEKVLGTLKEAHRRYKKVGEQEKVQKLQIKTAGRTLNVDFYSIYFFEAIPGTHKLVLHLENEFIEFYGRLKDFENVHENLYRCHKSFIVNKNKIVKVDAKSREVFLENGEVCYASVRLVKFLLK